MEVVGIICEYNPFHNGHVYHLECIRKMYSDAIIVLVLGGNFLERGDVSIISKWNKTRIALLNGVDIVMELPTLYNTNSADIFAQKGVSILNSLGVEKLVFGSESNDLELLKKVALVQDDEKVSESVRANLKDGMNYPTSLASALNVTLKSNDILGVAYIKAINEINPSIEPVLIKRTNDYNDVVSCEDVISASNIRARFERGENVEKYIPNYDYGMLNKVDYEKMFEMLKFRIRTENHLERYLGVDEGLENRLKKIINDAHNYQELIELAKSKRYTTSRIKRMFIHILLGIEKDDINLKYEDNRILGFNERGQEYIKKKNLKVTTRAQGDISQIENRSAHIYYELTGDETSLEEFLNKPIIKGTE